MLVVKILAIAVLLVFSSCSGGGGSKKPDLNINSEGEIELLEFAESGLPVGTYSGTIGGMIGASAMLADTKGSPVVVWGRGNSLTYGTINVPLGSASLPSEGNITALAKIGTGKVIFGTDHGIGLALFDKSSGGRFRASKYFKLDNGIVCASASGDGVAYLVDSAGNVLRATEDQLNSESKIELIRSPESWSEEKQLYAVSISASNTDVAVLLQSGGPMLPFDTNYETVLPVLSDFAAGTSTREVRLIVADKVIETKQETKKRSVFVPTGISLTDSNIIIAGAAFNPTQLGTFTHSSECEGETDKPSCLLSHAIDGSLFYSNDGGISGRMLKVDTSSNEIETSKEIYLEPFVSTSFPAPPLVFTPAAAGDNIYVRGTSFLMEFAPGDEGLETLHQFMSSDGKIAVGWPRDVTADINEGALMTVVQPRYEGIPAYSAIEHINADAEKRLLDSASSSPEIEGYSDSKFLVIERREETGGDLYLADTNKKSAVAPVVNAPWHISAASLNGDVLAFAWTAERTSNFTWTIELREKPFSDEGKSGSIYRSYSVPSKEYEGFPQIASDDSTYDRDLKQGIADMKWSGGDLYILMHGFDSGTHYFRACRYKVSDGVPSLGDRSKLLTVKGDKIFKAAKLLNVDDDTIYFSAPDGIYKAVTNNSTTTKKVVEFNNLISIANSSTTAVAIDNGTLKKVAITGGTPKQADLAASSDGAGVGYAGNVIIVSLPSNDPSLMFFDASSLSQLASSNLEYTAESVTGLSQGFLITPAGSIEIYGF